MLGKQSNKFIDQWRSVEINECLAKETVYRKQEKEDFMYIPSLTIGGCYSQFII